MKTQTKIISIRILIGIITLISSYYFFDVLWFKMPFGNKDIGFVPTLIQVAVPLFFTYLIQSVISFKGENLQ